MHAKHVDAGTATANRLMRDADRAGLGKALGTRKGIATNDLCALAGEISFEERNRFLMLKLLCKHKVLGKDTLLKRSMFTPPGERPLEQENIVTKSIKHARKLNVPKMSVKIVQPFDDAPPGADYIVAESSWPQLPPYKKKHEQSGKLIAWKHGLDESAK